MSNKKWFGAAVGFIFGGPVGAAAGFALGAAGDELDSSSADGSEPSSNAGSAHPRFESIDSQFARMQDEFGNTDDDWDNGDPAHQGDPEFDERDADTNLTEYEWAHKHGGYCPHGIPTVDCNSCRD